MDPSLLAILLLLAALALLIAEIPIPSGGMMSVLAIICLIGSVLFAWNAWWEESPSYFWIHLATVLLSAPLSIALGVWLLPRTPFGRQLLLEAPDENEVTPYAREQQRLATLIGKRGRTLTLMNPGGLVQVEGERMHAEVQGMILDAGEDVKVVGVKVNRIVVRKLTEAERRGGDEFTVEDDAERDRDGFDFDLPT